MKTRKLMIIAIIAAISIAFTLSACAKTPNVSLTQDEVAFYSSWMQNIQDDTPINKIAILGSHDSGTYDMKHIIMKPYTITQSLTIKVQLQFGTRYFDIRVNKKKNGSLNIFHAPDTTGSDFNEVANDINDFMQTNTSEFLVLDFQHFNNEQKNSESSTQSDVIKTLDNLGILKYAVTNNTELADIDFVTNLKLKDVRGKVIIVWGSNEANDEKYPYLFRRNNDSCTIENAVLDSLYKSEENKKSTEKFIAEALPLYMSHIQSKTKGLTVLQGQLTAPGLNNLKKLESKHNANMSKFVREIENEPEYLNCINIIMRDFIGSDKEKTNSVLYLNFAKGIVKSEYIKTFVSFCKAI